MNRLRFVVDAEGNVLSYELVGRSGNADLDRATLDMIRRAQPLPKATGRHGEKAAASRSSRRSFTTSRSVAAKGTRRAM